MKLELRQLAHGRLPPVELLAPGCALAVLLLVAVILLASRTSAIVASRAVAVAAAPAPALNATAAAAATSDPRLERLTDSDLFGHYDPAAAAAAMAQQDADSQPVELGDAAPSDLPPAELGLTLQGVVYRETQADRRAIIAGASGEPEAYHIGDVLPGDAVIRYIETRRIVVEHAGELKELPLTEQGLPEAREAATVARVDAMARLAALRRLRQR